MTVRVRDLGVVGYGRCWQMQQRLFDTLVARKAPRRMPAEAAGGAEAGPAAEMAEAAEAAEAAEMAETAGTVLLVEHPPVYTLGKSGREENLLVDREMLERLGAEFFHIDRGGDITFHGPGQLVCYPVLDLERIGIGLREYIERLEEAVIRTVACYGIGAGRVAGASGVWIGMPQPGADAAAGGSGALRKICAIGVRSSRYVTMHGLALNVNTDLEWFSRINPCGFRDRGVTSIARETGREVPMAGVKEQLIRSLGEQLDVEMK